VSLEKARHLGNVRRRDLSFKRCKVRDQPLLGLMDIKVQRNAFGRQVDSFETDLEIDELMKATGTEHAYHAVFIRAPLIESVHGMQKCFRRLKMGALLPRRKVICWLHRFTLN
jgi:glutamine amidotransferase PdxT